jgi:phage shock protein C
MNTTVHPGAGHQPAPQPLTRPGHDRMLAGVASGVARYLGADVTLIRIAFVVLAIVGGAGVPLYLAGWLLIPEEDTGRSIAGDVLGSRQARSH